MQSFKKFGAQGEVDFNRIDELPKNLIEQNPSDGVYIIGHSENGHHHVLDCKKARFFKPRYQPGNGTQNGYLMVKERASVNHTRHYDTHKPIVLEPGIYKTTILREFDHYEKLSRRVCD